MPALRPPFTPEQRADIEARAEHYHIYRPAYVSPARHVDGPREKDAAPWKTVSVAEVERWRARDLANRWASEPGIAQALAWLAREFGGRA